MYNLPKICVIHFCIMNCAEKKHRGMPLANHNTVTNTCELSHANRNAVLTLNIVHKNTKACLV